MRGTILQARYRKTLALRQQAGGETSVVNPRTETKVDAGAVSRSTATAGTAASSDVP